MVSQGHMLASNSSFLLDKERFYKGHHPRIEKASGALSGKLLCPKVTFFSAPWLSYTVVSGNKSLATFCGKALFPPKYRHLYLEYEKTTSWFGILLASKQEDMTF